MEHQTERSHQGIPTTNLEMSSHWRHKALYHDLIRGTRLGTLGYLPFEIRQEIWKHLFVFEYWRRQYESLSRKPHWMWIAPPSVMPKKSDTSDPLVFWSRKSDDIFDLHKYHVRMVRLGVWCRVKSKITQTLKKIRNVSEDMIYEAEKVFLSNQNFAFSDPADLTRFCQLLPSHHRGCLRAVSLWFGIHHLWTKGTYFTTPTYSTYFTEVGEWTDAISHLPSTVQSVTIRVGKMCTEAEDIDDEFYECHIDTEKQRCTLYTIAEMVKKVVPKTTIAVDRESVWVHDPEYKKKIAGYRATIRDATTASSDSDNAKDVYPSRHLTLRSKPSDGCRNSTFVWMES